MTDPDPEPPPDSPKPGVRRRLAYAAAHLLLAWHLMALCVGPATMPPASPLQTTAARAFAPYIATLYLGHGYHFFAPDPGPSTLLRYSGTTPDGTPVAGTLPDLGDHVPRLLYHRHFMLTERLGGPLARSRDYHRALADGLFLATGAGELSLAAVTHRTPEPREVQLGFGLDDPALYSKRPLGTFRREPRARGSE